MDWQTKMTQKTLADFTQELKAEYPTLTKGNNDNVVTLESDEYESVIAEWAETKLAEQEKEATDAAAAIQAEADKAALLAKLGITADEAKLLLS